jgi:MFS family permease
MEKEMRINFNKNLVLLLSGQLVSQVGDKFYLLALSFWVLKATGSPAMMGLVLACSLFPSLLLGFVSGAFIDRYSRKAIIVGTDMIRGLVILSVAAAYYMKVLDVPIIIVSQVLLSINAAFFDPAIPSVIPQIVPREELAKANSKTQFIRGISAIAGPVLGGVAVAGLGYGFAFVFNGLSFLVSAFFEAFLKIPRLVRDKQEIRKKSLSRDIIEGYKYIIMDKGLIIILLMVAVIHFFVGSIEVIIPVLADSLAGDGARNLGYIQAAFGSGAVLMALIISIHNITDRKVRFLFHSIFLVGIGYVTIAFLSFTGILLVAVFLPVFLLIGSFVIMAGTCFKTILQENVDDSMAGRVFGVVSSVGNGSIPFAMMVYGFLLTYINVYNLVLVTGLILLPLSTVFYRKYKRRIL